MAGPSVDFWQERFERNETPWDRGRVSPQLLHWLEQGLIGPAHRIAVPGCGSGHEVLALAQAGCQVTGIDYAEGALKLCRQRLEDAGLGDADPVELVQADVLSWQPAAPFDIVYDQTCWCALHPDHWRDWADQLYAWVRPGGTLGLMAMQAQRDSATEGVIEGPPYHLDINMLRALLPSGRWHWPAPPYGRVDHHMGRFELALVLRRL